MKKIKLCMVGLIVVLVSIQIVAISSNMSSYDPWLDLNDDGIIDAIDLQILAWMYGTSGIPINKTELLLELEARLDRLNATLLTDYYNITDCDVIFVDASGDTILGYLDVDSGTLYVDNVSDRVGIGTSSPDAKLDIYTYSGDGLWVTTTNNGFLWNMLKIANTNNWAANAGLIDVSSSSGTQFLVTGDGRVGIGTATPGYLLDVYGSAPALRLMRSSTSGTESIIFADMTQGSRGGIEYYGSGGGTDYMAFKLAPAGTNTAGIERLRIDGAGNVGIGTMSPTAKLDVAGDARISGSLTRAGNTVWDAGNDGSGSGLNADILDGYDSSAFVKKAGDTMTGSLTISGYQSDLTLSGFQSGLTISPSVGHAYLYLNRPTSTVDAAGIRFQTAGVTDFWTGVYTGTSDYGWEAGGSNRMLLTSTGNLGIGTTSPAYKLDVEGYVQAHGYYTGDIIFQSQGEKLWRMFEDEKGLYLENLKDSKVYSFVLQDAESGGLLELSGTHFSITEGVVGFIVALGLVFSVNKYKAKTSTEELDPQQTTLSQWQ